MKRRSSLFELCLGCSPLIALASQLLLEAEDFFDLPILSVSSWQNGVGERWVQSCRRDLLDHVIAVNERHLNRLLSD
jgi:hypothetical protein